MNSLSGGEVMSRRIPAVAISLLGGLAGISLALMSCSASRELAVAREQVIAFQRSVSKGQSLRYYDSATERFNARRSREDFDALSKRISNRLGNCGSPKIGREVYIRNTAGSFVTLTSQRTCERGPIIESFRWQIVEGTLLLDSYSAQTTF